MSNLMKITNSLLDGAFDEIFEESYYPLQRMQPVRRAMANQYPATNIQNLKDKWNIQLAAPGLKRGDFKLLLEGEALSVSFDREQGNNNDFVRTSFNRTWAVPRGVETKHIKAKYDAGVLNVEVSKPSVIKGENTLIKVS